MEELVRLCACLSDRLALEVLFRLRGREMNVADVCEQTGATRDRVQLALARLGDCGLCLRLQVGPRYVYRVEPRWRSLLNLLWIVVEAPSNPAPALADLAQQFECLKRRPVIDVFLAILERPMLEDRISADIGASRRSASQAVERLQAAGLCAIDDESSLVSLAPSCAPFARRFVQATEEALERDGFVPDEWVPTLISRHAYGA